jgi:glycosyltransferase involved in cell wall biosynthesis
VDALPGEHFVVADTAEEKANAMLRLLEDRGERQRLAVAGQARMLSHHSWSSSMRRLDAIIERSLNRYTRPH